MTIAAGFHLFPFRTEKLRPPAPMVLHISCGRVGRRHSFELHFLHWKWSFFSWYNASSFLHHFPSLFPHPTDNILNGHHSWLAWTMKLNASYNLLLAGYKNLLAFQRTHHPEFVFCMYIKHVIRYIKRIPLTTFLFILSYIS